MSTKALPPRPNLEQYKKQAKDLLKAFKSHDPNVVSRVRRHHPRLRGRPDTNDRNDVTEDEIWRVKFSLADAQFIIAREHQFESWPKFAKEIEALNRKGSKTERFEAAVDAIVSGDLATLKQLLRADPELIRQRSTREHRAMLLHYVAANAVEGYRQKTPKNIVEITEVLLKAGAEVDVDLDYGRMKERYPERKGSTTLGLAATSCHPADAGVQIKLLETLLKHGASINGLPGGWNPVIAALHNGRGNAAAYLAEQGAQLNLEGAAGAGRLDVVKTFFSEDGTLKPGATQEQLELGFAWACEYGHADVAEFLLKKGLNVAAQPHGETGLHWAAYGGHAGIVEMLLQRGAPVNVHDLRFDATPLGWALHGWTYPAPEANPDGYYEVVARLVGAGSIVDPNWLSDANGDRPIAQKVQADKQMLRALTGKTPGIGNS
jgi:ankyrin repeat protein